MEATIQYRDAEILRRLATDWATESAGYYDTPHGCHSIPADSLAGTGRVTLGATEAESVGCGYWPDDRSWVRSSGTWAQISDDYLSLRVAGPRHSVVELLPADTDELAAGWEYITSWRKDVPPWAVGLDSIPGRPS